MRSHLVGVGFFKEDLALPLHVGTSRLAQLSFQLTYIRLHSKNKV